MHICCWHQYGDNSNIYSSDISDDNDDDTILAIISHYFDTENFYCKQADVAVVASYTSLSTSTTQWQRRQPIA